MNSKEKIIKKFDLSDKKVKKIDLFINEIKNYNSHTNIVGKSTLQNPWNRHVLDSLQLLKFIKKKNTSILDLGAGAGIPGIFLAIANQNNISLIDSSSKKIKFMRNVANVLNLNVKIYHNRIEKIKNLKFKYLISRALANLNKLFFYSQNLIKNDTVLIFLKGRTANDEINEAKLSWVFKYKTYDSLSDKYGKILMIENLKKKWKK